MCARTSRHGVGAKAGDHGLAAVAQQDDVVATLVGIGGLQPCQHARRRPLDLAVVAQYQIGASAAPDGIGTSTTQDDLVAVAQRDRVCTAHGGGAGLDLLQGRLASEVTQFAVVTQHHVGALA